MGRAPTVFVVSDSSDNIEFRLFPKDILNQLGISKITFNPVAATSMTKALGSVLDRAAAMYKIVHEPTSDDLNQMVVSSAGDIRSAINALEFFCSAMQAPAETKRRPLRPPAKRSRKAQPTSAKKAAVGTSPDSAGRDSSLHVFHSLGKILYCKRDPSKMADCDRLPPHLKDLERPPPIEVPEEVFERTQTSGDTFSLLLHHNAGHFYADIGTAADCTEWFSRADFLLSEWSSDNKMDGYALSLVTRGLMFDLRRPEVSRGWRPLEKAQWNPTHKHVKQKLIELKDTFRGCWNTGLELQLDLVPYLALLKKGDLSQNKRAMAEQIGILNIGQASSCKQNETLDDRDCEMPAEDSVDYSGDRREKLSEFSDEEVVIEDYDD